MDPGNVKFRQFWHRNLNLAECIFFAQSNCDTQLCLVSEKLQLLGSVCLCVCVSANEMISPKYRVDFRACSTICVCILASILACWCVEV